MGRCSSHASHAPHWLTTLRSRTLQHSRRHASPASSLPIGSGFDSPRATEGRSGTPASAGVQPGTQQALGAPAGLVAPMVVRPGRHATPSGLGQSSSGRGALPSWISNPSPLGLGPAAQGGAAAPSGGLAVEEGDEEEGGGPTAAMAMAAVSSLADQLNPPLPLLELEMGGWELELAGVGCPVNFPAPDSPVVAAGGADEAAAGPGAEPPAASTMTAAPPAAEEGPPPGQPPQQQQQQQPSPAPEQQQQPLPAPEQQQQQQQPSPAPAPEPQQGGDGSAGPSDAPAAQDSQPGSSKAKVRTAKKRAAPPSADESSKK